jgi:hypothetical protein
VEFKENKYASVIFGFFVASLLCLNASASDTEKYAVIPQFLIESGVAHFPLETVLEKLSLDSKPFLLEKQDLLKNSVSLLAGIGVTCALYKSGTFLFKSENRIGQLAALYCFASCFVYPKRLISEKAAHFSFKQKHPRLFGFCLYAALGLCAWKARLLSKNIDLFFKFISCLPKAAPYMFRTKII